MTSSTSCVVVLEHLHHQHVVQFHLFNCSDFVHNLCSIGDLAVCYVEPEILLFIKACGVRGMFSRILW